MLMLKKASFLTLNRSKCNSNLVQVVTSSRCRVGSCTQIKLKKFRISLLLKLPLLYFFIPHGRIELKFKFFNLGS